MPWYKYACFWKENLFCKPQGVRKFIIAVLTHIYGVFTTRTANPYCKVVKLEIFMCDKHIPTLCWQTEVILVFVVKKYSAQWIKVFVWSFPNHLLTLHLLVWTYEYYEINAARTFSHIYTLALRCVAYHYWKLKCTKIPVLHSESHGE